MKFGTWIKSAREAEDLSLRAFSQKVGVDFSTLQRIEAGLGEPSLRTAFQICRGLGLTVDQMIDRLTESGRVLGSNSEQDFGPGKPMVFLTRSDILSFIESDETAVKIAYKMIELMVKQTKQHPTVADLNTERSSKAPIELPFLLGGPVFDVKVRLPTFYWEAEVPFIRQIGGALSLREIGTYIRELRMTPDLLEEEHIAGQGNELGPSISDISASTLSRIEMGLTGNIKLRDALMLDQILGQDSSILKMYWNAPELDDRRFQAPTLPGLWITLDVDFFIFSGRWLSLTYGEEHSWVEILRTEAVTSS